MDVGQCGISGEKSEGKSAIAVPPGLKQKKRAILTNNNDKLDYRMNDEFWITVSLASHQAKVKMA